MPSQQLPFVYTTTTVTDDLEEFAEPVYDQVHQEQIAASEMTENIAEILVVQEQVIVGTRPVRLVDARGRRGGWSVRHARALNEAPLLSPVVMVQEAAHDDITAAFLLTQSLRQRQEEVEDAAMGREEDVEEDDRLVEYFSEDCVFLEMQANEWQSRGHGVARCCGTPMERLSSSSGRVSSSSMVTSSRRLVVLVSSFDLLEVEVGVFLRGRTRVRGWT